MFTAEKGIIRSQPDSLTKRSYLPPSPHPLSQWDTHFDNYFIQGNYGNAKNSILVSGSHNLILPAGHKG